MSLIPKKYIFLGLDDKKMPIIKKWAMVGGGFGLIFRGNCARKYGKHINLVFNPKLTIYIQ